MLVCALFAGMLIAAGIDAQSTITPSAANPLSLTVCKPEQVPTFAWGRDAGGAKIDDQLDIFCPGSPKPVLTILGCVDAKVKRVGKDYALSCTSWRGYVQRRA